VHRGDSLKQKERTLNCATVEEEKLDKKAQRLVVEGAVIHM
jgi:hypothetical protein